MVEEGEEGINHKIFCFYGIHMASGFHVEWKSVYGASPNHRMRSDSLRRCLD